MTRKIHVEAENNVPEHAAETSNRKLLKLPLLRRLWLSLRPIEGHKRRQSKEAMVRATCKSNAEMDEAILVVESAAQNIIPINVVGVCNSI